MAASPIVRRALLYGDYRALDYYDHLAETNNSPRLINALS
jgi:hypothetical protein